MTRPWNKHAQPSNTDQDQFYRVRKEKVEYWGERYFRFNATEDKVVQVVLVAGEVTLKKAGRHSCIGIYLIGRLSFLSNYFGIGYCESITQEQYEEQFDKVVKILK